jgi:SAM-dependent methyltransferase
MVTPSAHYSDSEGEKYFDWQKQIGALGGRLNLFKFAPFLRPEIDVCDFGCGGGFLLDNISGVRSKCGVEVNPAAQAAARAKGLTVHGRIEDVAPSSLDLIISNHALEHVPDPLGAIRSLKDCLRAGGKMVFCLPIDDWRAQRKYDPRDINHHLYTWTSQLVGNLFTEAGMTLNEVRILLHAWTPQLHGWFGWSSRLFNAACYLNAVALRRRQLLVVATRP